MQNHTQLTLSFLFPMYKKTVFRILILLLGLASNGKSAAQTIDTTQIRQLEKSGDQLRSTQKYKEAVGIYQRTIAMSDSAGFHALFVPAIYPKIAECYEKQTSIDSAAWYYRKASRVYNDQLPDPGSEQSLRPILNFSTFFNTWRILDSAVYYANLVLQRSGPLTDSTMIQSDAYFALGNALVNMSLFDQSIAAYKSCLLIRTKLDTKQAIKLYQPAYGLGTVYRVMGNPQEARNWQLKALPFAEAANDKLRVSNCLRELGWCDFQQDKYEDAVTYWRKVIEIRSALFGADAPRLSDDYKNLSQGLRVLGQVEEALSNMEKAVFLAEKRYTPTHPDLANTYNAYSACLTAVARYEEALQYYQKALAVQEKGKFKMDEALTLGNLGSLYANIGKYDSAKIYLDRGLMVLRANNLTQTITMRQIAYVASRVYSLLNKFDEARSIALEGLASDPDDKFSPSLDLQLHDAMGIALMELDSSKAAQVHFKRALELAGYDPTDTLFSKAIPLHYSDAVRIYAWYLLQLVNNGARDQLPKAISFIETLQRYGEFRMENDVASSSRNSNVIGDYLKYNTGIEIYLQAGKPDKALEMIESVKARNLFAESACKYLPLPDGFPATWNQQEQDLRLTVSNLREIAQKAEPEQRDRISLEIYKNMADLQDLRRQMKTQFPDYYRQLNGIPSYDLNRLRANYLSPQTVLIEYFIRNSNLHIVLVTRDTIIIWYKEPKEAISETVDRYLNLMINKDLTDLKQLKQQSYDLYQLLLSEPLQAAGTQVNRLIIATDESVGAIPFGALLNQLPATNELGKWPFLAKKYTIRHSASISTLLQQERISAEQKPGGGFLGFAPSYLAGDSSIASKGRGELIRNGNYDLPNARKEVREISALLGGKAVLDTAATETVFRKLFKQFDIIHLAMHGLPNQLQPDFSKLLFRAGAPNAASDANGDLTAAEILALRVPAKMVVLSACHSGAGRRTSGEGVLSLSYSFIAAGAPAVVSTLWQADDKNTAAFMLDFYTAIKAGKPKDEALRTAQLRMIARAGEDPALAHPYFWAPFVLYGSNRPLR